MTRLGSLFPVDFSKGFFTRGNYFQGYFLERFFRITKGLQYVNVQKFCETEKDKKT